MSNRRTRSGRSDRGFANISSPPAGGFGGGGGAGLGVGVGSGGASSVPGSTGSVVLGGVAGGVGAGVVVVVGGVPGSGSASNSSPSTLPLAIVGVLASASPSDGVGGVSVASISSSRTKSS